MTVALDLPPPTAFGLPDKFASWYPDQWAAVETVIDTDKSFVALNLPTGAGKTLIHMAVATLSKGRAVLLTSTKGLQRQVVTDFEGLGLVDISGQNNYPCQALQPGGLWASLAEGPDGDPRETRCDHGPCHGGLACALREGGCDYYDRVRLATGAELVCTNYAYWFAQRRYGRGLGQVDLLLADEAHHIGQELSQAVQIKLDRWLCHVLHVTPPGVGSPLDQWAGWGGYQATALTARLEEKVEYLSRRELQHRRRERQLASIGEALAQMRPGDWIEDHTPDAWVFDCLNPKAFVPGLLVQGAKKVVLTSATVTEATLDELGFAREDRLYAAFPSRFPVERRPVWYIPTAKVDYKMGEGHWKMLASRIDQILDRWPDEKGIIHAVSYARAKEIKARSRHAHRMIVPEKGSETKRAVEEYLKTPGPWVLVSPAVTTGWDFPGKSCRFALIVKLPFPGSQSKTVQARTAADPMFVPNLVAQTLVQSLGRGMRSVSDWQIGYVLDTNWGWFRGKYKALFPGWFLQAVKETPTIPVRPAWAYDGEG